MAVYAYAWFRLHLHDCIHWCCMDITLKDLQVHNLKHYPHHSPLTQRSGNPNFEGQRDSFYFYWYSNVKSFMVVGNPCLQSTMALWHCISRWSLLTWHQWKAQTAPHAVGFLSAHGWWVAMSSLGSKELTYQTGRVRVRDRDRDSVRVGIGFGVGYG